MLDCLIAQSEVMVERQACTSLCFGPIRRSERSFKEGAMLMLIVAFGNILGECM